MDRTSPTHGWHWTISAGQHQAEIVQCGAALQSYRVAGRALADHFGDDELPVGYAGQLLAPWPNRVADGAYTWRGEHLQLPLNEPARGHAIHGLLCWEPWTLLGRAADRLLLERTLFPRPGYPFAITVTVEWSVSADGLRCHAAATNPGSAAAPFGFGAHPLPAGPRNDRHRRPAAAAAGGHPAADRRAAAAGRPGPGRGDRVRLPCGRAARRAAAGRRLHRRRPRVGRDHACAAARPVRRRRRDLGRWCLRLLAGVHRRLAAGVVRPPRAAVAVEPMTCPADAFNSGEGLVTLDPGARWEGTWGIRPC